MPPHPSSDSSDLLSLGIEINTGSRMLDIESPLVMALAYASHGWAVFPLHTVVGGACDCRKPCLSPGKHPRTKKGFKDATTEPEKVKDWWSMWPSANVGIATGRASGLVVVDIDPRNGGLETVESLAAVGKVLYRTAQVLTQGGGFHLYYRYPEGVEGTPASSLGEGIDLKSDGGYVAAPPSRGVDGVYLWQVACELAPL